MYKFKNPKEYMTLEVFYTDAIYYVQMPEKMPLVICSAEMNEEKGYEVPVKNKPIAVVISPEQLHEVQLLEKQHREFKEALEEIIEIVDRPYLDGEGQHAIQTIAEGVLNED